MIDSFTNKPIQISNDGDSSPYIMVQLDQLELVKDLLTSANIRFIVGDDAISFDDQPYTAILDLDHRIDLPTVQKLLDDAKDPKTARLEKSRGSRRG